MSSKLEQLQKQNDGMYNNLVKNNVSFTRKSPSSDEDHTQFYLAEQQELKNALAEFRKLQPKLPVPAPKIKQPKVKQEAKKEVKLEKDEDDDEVLVDKKPNHQTFTNMEDMKRAFCNNEIDEFIKLLKSQPYLFYKAEYKYASDMDGKPDYVARNFVKGFIKNLDDYRKYFFNCFRCYESDRTYKYPSWWIVNTPTDMPTILGDYVDDFTFTQLGSDDLDKFIKEFNKVPEDSVLAESYLH
jgi:hypothetical protein